jgi:hypothetical protein
MNCDCDGVDVCARGPQTVRGRSMISLGLLCACMVRCMGNAGHLSDVLVISFEVSGC